MIVGLISDTHGLLRAGVHEVLAGVSLILHAGDVGSRDVLDELGIIAPTLAVSGNTDPSELGLPPTVVADVGGLLVRVVHGHEVGSPTPERLLAEYREPIVVFGHTHVARVERVGERLAINPGAAGPRRFKLAPSVARLQVTRGVAEVEIIPLGD
jgi:putative phosphoesterase